ALSSAIIKDFLEKENIFAFYSTHFMELPRMNGIDFFRMKGLNYIEYKKSFNEQKKYELNDRIRMINLFMRYEIEPDDSNREYFDAINIANILGLDIKIIEDAKKQLR
ncbi:MAG: hypothetical protein NTY22_06315, partial [Proteobacteria bacterium]|nr:hypothetical protein [Pseudomonadota bacterium]